MWVIWLGVLFVLAGLLFMVLQPIWRARFSVPRPPHSVFSRTTLEPRRPGAGFDLKTNLPGLVLVVLGGLLLVLGAVL